MFTGIVEGRGEVVAVSDAGGLRRLVVRLPAGGGARGTAGLVPGASVAIAGTCLTAVTVSGGDVAFDCIDETLARTTLGALRVGDQVNVERAARFGDEIGGHLLSGHIDGPGEIVLRDEPDGNLALTVRVAPALHAYVFEKGYIGIDGASLTVGAVDRAAATFRLHLIPETRRLTTLGAVGVGARVNVEIDATTRAVVDTVRSLGLSPSPPPRG